MCGTPRILVFCDRSAERGRCESYGISGAFGRHAGRDAVKPQTIMFISVVLVSISLSGFGQDKYIPKPNEELYKTWENDNTYPQKTVNFLGGYKDYYLNTDPTPTAGEGTEQIMKKWTDADGNIWYWTFGKVTTGTYAGAQYQTLSKISHNGTLRELVVALAAYGFNPNNPVEIDPSNSTYRVYHRYGN